MLDFYTLGDIHLSYGMEDLEIDIKYHCYTILKTVKRSQILC